MKKKSKWLIKTLAFFTDFNWYASFVFLTIGLIALTAKFITDDYTECDLKMRYNTEQMMPNSIEPTSKNIRDITIKAQEALLSMEIRHSAARVTLIYLGFFIGGALIIMLLYNLRKIMKSLKKEEPFTHENICRLKRIALYSTLFTPLSIFNYFGNLYTLKKYVPNLPEEYWLVGDINFMGLIIGVILFILADIFRYGFEIYEENKEFV